MTDTQLAVVGAGPAGLAAATAAAEHGVAVTLLDEQPAGGGQIYRGAGRDRVGPAGDKVFGVEYGHGRRLIAALPERVNHLTDALVWQLTPERELYFSRHGKAQRLRAEQLILATGALERPMPFPGWTLPGVMTAGAGQILLKTAGLVPRRAVLAGSGPLLLLLAAQYLRAGGEVTAIVDTTPAANYRHALPLLPGALRAGEYLGKGWRLLREIKAVPRYRHAQGLIAEAADQKLAALRFRSRGKSHRLECEILLLHLGVVPNVQLSRSLDLTHDWYARGRCFRPRLDADGGSELDGVWVVGDGGGINGALAAEYQGRIAGLRVAERLGKPPAGGPLAAARKALARERAVRPFLDTLYAPAAEFLNPPDATVVCRCEEVSAGQLRDHVRVGCLGPNQTKAFGRAGMGPCQGRYCGLTVSEIIAAARGLSPAEVGYYRIRPPIKPITLGELAELPSDDADRQHG